jgi:hypothetical protein
LTARYLDSVGAQGWILGFISNTGVTGAVVSPAMPSAAAALIRRDGIAGQWVVEAFRPTYEIVASARGIGYRYSYRQLLCTREEGITDVLGEGAIVMTVPLSASPLTDPIAGLTRARRLALQSISADFHVMSAALARPSSGAEWHFRFYDSHDVLAHVTISGDGRRVLRSE